MSGIPVDELCRPAGLLALQALPGLGPVTALRAARDPVRMQALERAHGGLRLQRELESARARLRDHVRAGVQPLAFFDERYPDRLRELPGPPALLYVRGAADILARKRLVAVVGTREPTHCGTEAAKDLTATLAAAGWGIVSGLAEGIDTVAHATALDHGAPTIAVMGGGLDEIYPPANESLAARILDGGGALVSEQPFGVPARRRRLTARDRLQSALSVAVLIVESEVEGGAMHTARFAARQDRPLFCSALPHAGAAGDGTRILLTRPARELCALLPAWRRSQALCARLGAGPLARPVSAHDASRLLEALLRAARGLSAPA